MKSKEKEKIDWIWWLTFPIIIVLWLLSPVGIVYVLKVIPESSETIWSVRGTFGDMFGAVNALFSGLAFAGMIIALVMQKKN